MPRSKTFDVLDSSELPGDVWDELTDAEWLPIRDGVSFMIYPENHPKLGDWLSANGHEVKPYLLQCSW